MSPSYTMIGPRNPWLIGFGETPPDPTRMLTYNATPQKHRPANSDGKKIPPSNLEDHCDAYNFRYPCCLCADGGGRGAYVESAVYSWWNKDTKKADWTPPASILEEHQSFTDWMKKSGKYYLLNSSGPTKSK
ncbi:uncharacterized protein F5891DRAFT_980949 [Suillus fuscotomentosus]|uniref:Uncharacterized protein n=1 Tax=Suillus fuscotomentosus TaxID=1912939 RepID=A0AAD4E4U6_9AGAM|nr:uncharacterized protein F5891DRAFT_980949 [Suillus fuscotomentosus]KAG1899721.1 hypothetical protein F5891DRAFT_980949 [Suillus fuscotomentosus]